MNENINLCKILKGLEGIELYSSAFGTVYLKSMDKYGLNVEAIIESETIAGKPVKGKLEYKYSRTGRMIDLNDADITLFPSKDQRDWSKFERPIPIDTPMMCSNDETTEDFYLRYYAGLTNNTHKCFPNGRKSIDKLKYDMPLNSFFWNIMIPFDKFNPNDIEESLKYNIQK